MPRVANRTLRIDNKLDMFNPEPAATADVSPSIIEWILRSSKPLDPSECLPAVAAGSGLNEFTAVPHAGRF